MFRKIFHTLSITQFDLTESAKKRLKYKKYKIEFLSILQFAIIEKSPFLEEILNLLK